MDTGKNKLYVRPVLPLNLTSYCCDINYCPEYNHECKFYNEEHDMGATIPICTKHNKFGNFTCLNCCDINYRSECGREYKFYEEEHDMGATIPHIK